LSQTPIIAVIGLGYVGLPLAVALARHYPVTGFDSNVQRIEELASGHDRTGEVSDAALRDSALSVTDDESGLDAANVFIVTVPTPVDSENRPDLASVLLASATVGRHLRKGGIVAYESTVYPGVTEDMCAPALQRGSGLKNGVDFFVGYSPERINPGDSEHGIEHITKVVAGQTPETLDRLAEIYGTVTNGNIYRASSIKTAEAAKVIENAQRDINIAFVNEVAMICRRIGLSTSDVLAAAATKWNFLDFQPGLVGGHCIGVDPYYLAHKAIEVGHTPEVLLAGRRINDSMGEFVAAELATLMAPPGRVLVLGLTFKEDIPDLRNSKVVDVIRGLESKGYVVDVHDPHADPVEAHDAYRVELLATLEGASGYRGVVAAVAHAEYRAFDAARIAALIEPSGIVADIKGIWRGLDLPAGLKRWTL
jgi:UDP-N-acetyl-D-galactosamine dehydrogenase